MARQDRLPEPDHRIAFDSSSTMGELRADPGLSERRLGTDEQGGSIPPENHRAADDVSPRVSRRRVLPALLGILLLSSGLALTGHNPEDPAPGDSAAPGTVAAIRECDLATAAMSLATGGRESRVLFGLAAQTCNDHDLALDMLSLPPAPEDRWEDWRLYTLAESARDLDDLDVATSAVDTLLEAHADSPLRPLTYLLAVEIARAANKPERALSLVRAARRQSLPDELRTDLDIQAWEAAQEVGRTVDLQESARELLLHSPADAADLNVDAVLTRPDGTVEWSDLFTRSEILLRAANLIAVDLGEEALIALDTIAEAERDTSWHLLRGQALVEMRRGHEAIDELVGVAATDLQSHLDLEWLRAQAALDAGTARRGRRNLPSSERQQMRLLARGHLWQIVQRGGESQRAVDALHLLFEEFADGAHFDQVRAILTRLQRLAPNDTTGAKYLWQLGWAEYRRRNLTGAIGYWSELVDIYPHSKIARGGRYWSARAHEALGNSPRARSLYEILAEVPSVDYYGKLARERLGLEPQPEVRLAGDTTTTWPRDPILDRAEALSLRGLDQRALIELEIQAEQAARRAERALRSLILARQGKRRESIQQIWRVFPILGGAYQDEAPPEALLMYYPLDYLDVVKRFARDNQLEVPLLLAMIRQESAFDIRARSWAGARGLMQVMPATGRELAAKMGLSYSTSRLNDPVFSVQLGSRYFRQVLDMFNGQLELALAGYNAGPYRIRRMVREAGPDLEIDSFLEDLRFEESKTYVKRITLFADSYSRLYPDLG